MGLNVYAPHALVLPEDVAFSDIAQGFADAVANGRNFRIENYGGGKEGLKTRVQNLLPSLARYEGRILIVLFDGDARGLFESLGLPTDRVFCLSTTDEAEHLRREFLDERFLKVNKLQEIGRLLASECKHGSNKYWNVSQLNHCKEVRPMIRSALDPILFS